ncbi:hypothetical protein ISF6_0841 [Piscinibacter sakaiensis]|uniref:Uncharacterized protein n=1 Tax=Piscinibacter sakaiensis TaxID=1547922 RepID=A0A0K8NZA0_PISS1|nr:hypothetical protein ISF6_0841 [Piscinibacter sakaiensis]
MDPAVDPQTAQAGRDLAEGQVDTDLRATPGLDAPRRRELLRREAAGAPAAAGSTKPARGRR